MQFDGGRLKAARRAARLSQAELALVTGVSEATIYRWETGDTEPDASDLGAIAVALNVPLEAFYEAA